MSVEICRWGMCDKEILLTRVKELNAENQRLRQALQDMTDGDEWWDIQECKGLPIARCKEILALLGGGE